jgi:hypothetical protein
MDISGLCIGEDVTTPDGRRWYVTALDFENNHATVKDVTGDTSLIVACEHLELNGDREPRVKTLFAVALADSPLEIVRACALLAKRGCAWMDIDPGVATRPWLYPDQVVVRGHRD